MRGVMGCLGFMTDAPFTWVFVVGFDRFIIAYAIFPVNPTKFHKKTRAKYTKTGSAFQWRTSVFAKDVSRKKQETRPRGEPRLGCSVNWNLSNCLVVNKFFYILFVGIRAYFVTLICCNTQSNQEQLSCNDNGKNDANGFPYFAAAVIFHNQLLINSG